ncbi:MAG: cbb3-type cytochrome c oxidase subunit 3 [Pseudomonadota bacterium]
MDTYSVLREFADSWFLIFMFAFFIGACIKAFWPWSTSERQDASMIPFRHDEPVTPTACENCNGGSCQKLAAKLEMETANG